MHLKRAGAGPTVSVLSDAAIVRCLGTFQVQVNGEEVRQKRWVSTEARDLLAFFIVHRGKRIPALDAVWPSAEGTGRIAFHTALTRMRKALRALDSLLVEGGEYWLDAARLRVDADDFDNALAKAGASVAEDEMIHWHERAVSLYHGEHMANLYYDWVFPDWRRLARGFLTALQTLAERRLAREDYEAAQSLLRQALESDPFREDLPCLMLRCFAGLKDRGGLVSHFRRMEELLQEELGVDPGAEARSLYQALLAGLSG